MHIQLNLVPATPPKKLGAKKKKSGKVKEGSNTWSITQVNWKQMVVSWASKDGLRFINLWRPVCVGINIYQCCQWCPQFLNVYWVLLKEKLMWQSCKHALVPTFIKIVGDINSRNECVCPKRSGDASCSACSRCLWKYCIVYCMYSNQKFYIVWNCWRSRRRWLNQVLKYPYWHHTLYI